MVQVVYHLFFLSKILNSSLIYEKKKLILEKFYVNSESTQSEQNYIEFNKFWILVAQEKKKLV